MNTRILLFLSFAFCFVQSLSAQALWENEAIVRSNNTIHWNQSLAHSPNGDTYILWVRGGLGNKGLFLHKMNTLGQSVWAQDICISNNSNPKHNYNIVTDSTGYIYIKWEESSNATGFLYLTKLNPNGEFIWQVQTINVSSGDMCNSQIVSDDDNGVYVVYVKYASMFHYKTYCQHFSSSGQAMLAGDGVELSTADGQEFIEYLKLTSDNGIIICKKNYVTSSTRTLSIIRLLPNHQIDWQHQLSSISDYQGTTFEGITIIDSVQYIVNWKEYSNSISYSFMQKFNLNGDFLFNPAILLASSSVFLNTSLCSDSQNNLIITVQNGDTNAPLRNYIQKYSIDGIALWTSPTVLPDNTVSIINPIPDNNGGCYFMMEYPSSGLEPVHGLKFQHINTTGQLLWSNDGYTIVDDIYYGYQDELAYTFTDRFYILWVNRYQDKNGIYCQIRNTEGLQISLPRLTIAEAIAGDVRIEGILPRASDIMVYWKDSRMYENSWPIDMYYYRFVYPDGTMSTPADGSHLLPGILEKHNLQSFSMPDGNIAFIWYEYLSGYFSIMGQAFNSSMNPLWGDDGRIFYDLWSVNEVTQFVVSQDGNDIYIAWSADADYYDRRVHVQKITSGMVMWGFSGLVINTGYSGASLIEEPVFLKDKYLVIKGQLGYNDNQYIWVTHLEADGSISINWLPNGYTVIDYPYTSGYLFDVNAVLSNGNLYVIHAYQNLFDRHYSYSVIQPDATVLVSQQLLLNAPSGESDLEFDTGEGLAYCLKTHSTTQMDLGYNKLSNANQHPWGNTIHYVCNNIFYNDYYIPAINRFESGGYLISWTDGIFLKGGYINTLGQYQSPLGGLDLIAYCRDNYAITKLDNELYIGWTDYKISEYTDAFREIRMQKFGDMSFVSNTDYTQPVINELLCYPNPFNSSLKIELTTSSKGINDITIFNVKGQVVKSINNTLLDKGSHTFAWNGKDNNGMKVSAGIYYFHLKNINGVSNSKVLYLK